MKEDKMKLNHTYSLLMYTEIITWNLKSENLKKDARKKSAMMDVTESPVLNVTISLLETVNESTPVVESIGGMSEELFNMTNPTMHTSVSLYCEMYNRNM